jgi:hypothetical protein
MRAYKGLKLPDIALVDDGGSRQLVGARRCAALAHCEP